ncbi:sensor histidine kinase [Rhodovulum sp. DZ06]|uniref:sensor histidine kinase n=1 Tax=Rhodovulum sp. DZ06 TaxID=3425126 RepID=UPI003D358294
MAAEEHEIATGAEEARRDRRHGVRLAVALGLAALVVALGVWRNQELRGRADDIALMTRDVAQVQEQARQIALWLHAEDAMPADMPREPLAPIAGAAMKAAQRLKDHHEAATRAAWREGFAGDLSESAAENFQRPAHQMDMMVRGFLRGVDRVAEASGERRAAARAELLELVEGALASGAEQAIATLDEVSAALRAEARATMTGAAAAALLCLAAALWMHLRGVAPALAAARRRAEGAEAAMEEATVRLRGAQRDRARMLDLAVAGLKDANERMRAAAGLLVRTPLSETQMRVLEGLRGAISDQADRLEGQRLLSAHGDGRLRLAARRVQPGAFCAEWLDEARRKAVEEGRTLIVESILDPEPFFRGDPALVRKALDRLLDDALRRVGKGGVVRLSARLERIEEGRAELRVVVEHDGPPPGPSEIAAARDPFTERPPSETTLTKGSDPFGLALALAICNASGGGLEIDGGPEAGTRALARFRFACDLVAVEAEDVIDADTGAFEAEMLDDLLEEEAAAALDPSFGEAPAATGERRSGAGRRRVDRVRDGAALRRAAHGADLPEERRSL